jgi:hypothetical protein
MMVRADGFAETEKPLVTVRVSIAFWVIPPPEPWTVIV